MDFDTDFQDTQQELTSEKRQKQLFLPARAYNPSQQYQDKAPLIIFATLAKGKRTSNSEHLTSVAPPGVDHL
jgi:hypothetical protein